MGDTRVRPLRSTMTDTKMRPVVHQLAPRADRDVIGRDDLPSVQREAAGLSAADDGRLARREPQQIAVLDEDRLGHLQRAGERAVGLHMPRLAMNRHRDLRSDPLVHLPELAPAGMAGDVDAPRPSP